MEGYSTWSVSPELAACVIDAEILTASKYKQGVFSTKALLEPLAEVVLSHFISLVQSHSKLKKVSDARSLTREVKIVRERCHRDFRVCAREILDGGLAGPHLGVRLFS